MSTENRRQKTGTPNREPRTPNSKLRTVNWNCGLRICQRRRKLVRLT